jgi:hypothetical protein
MADQEHLDILKQGVETWNAWRKANPEIVPDLEGADLEGANFRGANFRGANLIGAYLIEADLEWADLSRAFLSGAVFSRAFLIEADLSRADLSRANFSRANLTEANLSGANLSRADLGGANLGWTFLIEAIFSGAFLIEANFSGADLSGANFSGVEIGYTTFANSNLIDVQGLETIQHRYPSTIGIDTIYRSQGKIPEAFLRNCGVPDSFIDYIPSLIGAMQPVQYYSCFISYSTKDEDFARRLHERMRAEHLRVWFAPEDIQGGKKIHEQLERAIQLHDRLLLVLSEHSIESEWVTTEIYNARQVEVREQRRKLFPIRLCGFETVRAWKCPDGDTGKDLAREVREYFIPDFSKWKEHDAFEAAFARLLRDLKATEALPAP